MDDIILQELKRVVEQAVRPVRATIARKRRMREELLAHLTAIFEEEAGKLGDARAALNQAKRRFGDPRELTGQLQQAVPRWDRCRAILEQMGWRPGESTWHLAGRHFLVMLVIYGVALLVALPLTFALYAWYDLGKVPGHHDAGTAITLWFVLVLLNATLSLTVTPLLSKVGPALAGHCWGRVLLKMLCGLMVPLVFSGAFAGATLAIILMARQATEHWRYQREWA